VAINEHEVVPAVVVLVGTGAEAINIGLAPEPITGAVAPDDGLGRELDGAEGNTRDAEVLASGHTVDFTVALGEVVEGDTGRPLAVATSGFSPGVATTGNLELV